MSKILFINSCIRPESRTLVLARRLLDILGDAYDEVNVTDGGFSPLDYHALEERTQKARSGDFSGAVFAPARQFAQAETVVIAAPFWDLSFPSYLKIYFENILISGLTFTYKSGRPEGLCKAKRLYYVVTAGGAISPDFGFAYVKALAESFFGIPEISCFSAEGLDVIGNDVDRIMKDAAEESAAKCNDGGIGNKSNSAVFAEIIGDLQNKEVFRMNNRIFRKKSIDRMSSPEQLNDYIKVTNPGVWMVLAAIVILLVGVCVWGVFGTLETKLSVAAVSQDGHTVLYIKEGDLSAVKENMNVYIGDEVFSVVSVSAQPVAVTEEISEYARHTGELSVGEWVYVVQTDGNMPDGAYKAQIVTDSVSPLYFVFN